MKNILLIIVSVSLLFSSCKKEELNGDLAYLEGKWKLSLTINSHSGSAVPLEEDVCYLEFQHSGKIIFSDVNGKVIERGRIISSTSRPANLYPDGIYFQVEVKSNAVFNKNLNIITDIVLISTITQPLEIITNDIKYGAPEDIELLFRKM